MLDAPAVSQVTEDPAGKLMFRVREIVSLSSASGKRTEQVSGAAVHMGQDVGAVAVQIEPAHPAAMGLLEREAVYMLVKVQGT